METKEMALRLLVALLIGGMTGIERERSHQFAGFRTHILVAVGSCISSITSIMLFTEFSYKYNIDPARLSAQVLSGVGFLGAGAILKTSNGIRGLTTAAGIWTTACIGIAVGFGYYELSILAWLFVMITLYMLKYIDRKLFKRKLSTFTVKTYSNDIIPKIFEILEENSIRVKNMNITECEDHRRNINFTILHDRRIILNELIKELDDVKNIISIDYIE
ncbi:MAG TPA: MgtC/SapB family protein [Peptostreptococcaceae bacterium]|nr:MgtC/SapB family protein [Peptostreptococcaceae bacterium]